MKQLQRGTLAALALLYSFVNTVYGASLPSGFAEQKIADGLNPTSMAFAPDGRLFILEKNGKVRVIKNDILLPTAFVTLAVDSYNERGLLGIAFDPQFTTNHWVYLYYTVPAVGSTPAYHRISRFTANGDVAAPGETLIYKLDNLGSAGNHNGGSMFFDVAGYLYLTTGNAANSANSQNTTTTHGKLLRINANGTLPPTGSGPDNNPYDKGIWAYGLRNPFVAAYQASTNRIYINDVGESTWEEINLASRGANYGFSGGATDGRLNLPGKVDPIFTYRHANPATPTTGSSITGGVFYNPVSPQFPATYIGKYFFADYVSGWIRTLAPDNLPTDPTNSSGATLFATGLAAPINLQVAPDGSLWYLNRGSSAGGASNNTSTTQGSVWKIRYTANASPTISSHPVSTTVPTGGTASFTVNVSGAAPFTYKWQRNGVDIAGSTSQSSSTFNTYTISNVSSSENGAIFRAVVTNSSGNTAVSNGATLRVNVNQAPVVSVSIPAADQLWVAGQTIHFTATAVDPEDGPLPASAFQYSVTLNHQGTGAPHQHPFIDTISGVSSGSFVIPAAGEAGGQIDDKIWLTLNVSATDSANQSAAANASAFALRIADNPPITAAGLKRRFYQGYWNALPDFSQLTPDRTDTSTNFLITPNSATNDYFGFVFDGFIEAPSNGIYTFYLDSDDGSRLSIGSRVVVNNDGLHGAGQEKNGTIALQAGRHAIKVEYFERAYSNNLNVRWSSNAIAKQLIPNNRLFRSNALFFDNFADNSISWDWILFNGGWSEDDQVLTQTTLTAQDPKKALIDPADVVIADNATITARVRVDSWIAGSAARAGVSLNSNTTNGEGINLIFHGNNQICFLDDKRTYGPAYPFTWNIGTWYWFKLKRDASTYSGKVWADGAAEPATWPYLWTRTGRDGGFPGVNGGSGSSTVSFDNVTVE